jgi:Mn-dependent DtxR family transcriptional regulator
MVRRLAKRGYVNYERYRGFTLTREGMTVARQIKHRHRILTDLLQMLGLTAEVVADDVEDMEHHLRPQTLRAFESLVEHWRDEVGAHRRFLEFHRERQA